MNHTLNALVEEFEFEPMSEADLWLVGIFSVIVLIGLLVHSALFLRDFSDELSWLNMEIRRTEGSERQHYIRQRRRLWLSLLPFVKY